MITLDRKVSELPNDQISKELYSVYLYLDFSLYYQERGLDSLTDWYMIQAQEGRDRAMLLLQYSQNNGEHTTLKQMDRSDKVCSALKDPLGLALEHERYVASLIHTIYDAIREVKNYHMVQFLNWFVEEQGEEEKNTEDMVEKFELFGTDPKSLYMLNNEMTGHTYSVPSLVL